MFIYLQVQKRQKTKNKTAVSSEIAHQYTYPRTSSFKMFFAPKKNSNYYFVRGRGVDLVSLGGFLRNLKRSIDL